MPSPNDASTRAPARLLKTGAVAFAVIGGAMAAWGLDKWVHQPEARASQFGFEAPLWPAFTLFVVGAMVVGVALLWSAAGRVADGEDLFAQRHRRHPSETPDEANHS